MGDTRQHTHITENARHERETGVGIPLAYNEKKLYKILQFPLYLAVGRDQRTADMGRVAQRSSAKEFIG